MHLRRYFIAGLLVWLPIVVTFVVLSWIVGTIDAIVDWLPHAWRPDALLGRRIPGMGVVMAVAIVFLTGLVAANVLGQRLIRLWEALIHRIPIVKSIYASVKQVSETLFSDTGQAFRTVVLVQYPRHGTWTIAFVTGEPAPETVSNLNEHGRFLTVMVPTTPNPTSGFLLIVPARDVIPLDLSIDEALKYVISLGTLNPKTRSPVPPPADLPPSI